MRSVVSFISPKTSVVCALAVGMLALAGPATVDAQINRDTDGCLMEVGVPGQGFNCTSNDLTFVLVGLGTATDGCVDSGFGFCTPEGAPDPDPDGTPCAIDDPMACPMGETCRAVDELDIFLRASSRTRPPRPVTTSACGPRSTATPTATAPSPASARGR